MDFNNLYDNLYKINPDIIINCAAYTNVDKAELEEELVNLLNVKSVDFYQNGHQKITQKLYIFTDYVFDGSSSSPLNEDAITSPINIYGKSKLKGKSMSRE